MLKKSTKKDKKFSWWSRNFWQSNPTWRTSASFWQFDSKFKIGV